MTEFRTFIQEIQSPELFADQGYFCRENEIFLKTLNKKIEL